MKPCSRCLNEYAETKEYFVTKRGKLSNLCKNCSREERRRMRAHGGEILDRTVEGNYIICSICGDRLVQMTGSHLKKHSMTFLQYIEKYPNAPTMSSNLAEQSRVRFVELWRDNPEKMMAMVAKKAVKYSGKNHHAWKGGYDKPGSELYESGEGGGAAKFKARRRAIRLHGSKCMIPACDFDFVVHNHHITPRSEGGSHESDNCILLCPNHHALADAGVFTREYLRSLVLDRLSTPQQTVVHEAAERESK